MEKQDQNVIPPTALELPSFVRFVCAQLQPPFSVNIIERVEIESTRRKSKLSKRSSFPQNSTPSVNPSSAISPSSSLKSNDINVIAVQDALGRIIQLDFWHCKQIPSLLLKIIGLCVPFHLYLTKIAVRWGPSRGFGLKEIARFLPKSYLTDICLDDSPLPQRNYQILLEENTSLRRLSLARCSIDDKDCAVLASKLAYPLPASESLVSITLTSNFINDEGAIAFGNTLRSNRVLLHLDLAGNYVTDAGSASILEALMEFPLREDEVAIRNKRRVNHLILRIYENSDKEISGQIDEKSLAGDTLKNKSRSKLSRSKGKKVDTRATSEQTNQENITAQESGKSELGETPNDSFNTDKTYSLNGQLFSLGNMRLAYLNLAYNNLDHGTAMLLHRVLTYQVAKRKELQEPNIHRGLMRIVLDGNPMPKECEELQEVKALLEPIATTTKYTKKGQHKTRG